MELNKSTMALQKAKKLLITDKYIVPNHAFNILLCWAWHWSLFVPKILCKMSSVFLLNRSYYKKTCIAGNIEIFIGKVNLNKLTCSSIAAENNIINPICVMFQWGNVFWLWSIVLVFWLFSVVLPNSNDWISTSSKYPITARVKLQKNKNLAQFYSMQYKVIILKIKE